MAVWECPGCHRRVPDRIGVCHCGVRREQAALAPSAALRAAASPTFSGMPALGVSRSEAQAALLTVARGAWPYLLLFLLALGGAAAWGALWQPETIPPLLGRAALDRPSSRPSASPR